MNNAEIRERILRILGDIAPEADLVSLRPERALRDQLDIDSMDFLNFVIAIDRELHVDIPESDYRQLDTLESCVLYLAPRLAPKTPQQA
jgi:acyl carrier protein